MINPDGAKRIIELCEKEGLSRESTGLVLVAAELAVDKMVQLCTENLEKEYANSGGKGIFRVKCTKCERKDRCEGCLPVFSECEICMSSSEGYVLDK